MPRVNRPAIARLALIDQALRGGACPNATELARRLEVTRRTVYRDINYLRDHLSAPIEYDQDNDSYRYTDSSFPIPFLQMSEAEFASLFLAERLLQQYRGTPIAEDLRRIFSKMKPLLPEKVSVRLDHLAESVSVRPPQADLGDAARLRRLLAAAGERRQVQLIYRAASHDQTTLRVVDPYHLASIDGDWFLIGYCHLREEVRMFAPGRILEMRETGEQFETPSDFRIAEYLDVGFRKVRGSGPLQDIRLRFAKQAAAWVRDKTWHPTQAVEEEADGSLILAVRLNSLAEIKRWVLSFGASCEVLEPVELREDIAGELQRMLAMQAKLGNGKTKQGMDAAEPLNEISK